MFKNTFVISLILGFLCSDGLAQIKDQDSCKHYTYNSDGKIIGQRKGNGQKAQRKTDKEQYNPAGATGAYRKNQVTNTATNKVQTYDQDEVMVINLNMFGGTGFAQQNSLAYLLDHHSMFRRLQQKKDDWKMDQDRCEAPELTEEAALEYHFPGQSCDSSSDPTDPDTCQHGIRLGDDLYDMSMAPPLNPPALQNNCCRFYSLAYEQGSMEDFCSNSQFGKYLDQYEQGVSSIVCGSNASMTIYQNWWPTSIHIPKGTTANNYDNAQNPYYLQVNYISAQEKSAVIYSSNDCSGNGKRVYGDGDAQAGLQNFLPGDVHSIKMDSYTVMNLYVLDFYQGSWQQFRTTSEMRCVTNFEFNPRSLQLSSS